MQSLVVDGRFTFAFYELMVTSPVYQESILNSFRLGMITTIATTLLSLPLAFLLVRYDFAGKGFLNGLILVPMVLPPFVGAIGMKQMFARFGSINLLLLDLGLIDQPIDWFGGGGFVGVVILEVLHLYPIMYLNVAAALANVDPSLEEAARNMGSRGFRLFRTVTFSADVAGLFCRGDYCFYLGVYRFGDAAYFQLFGRSWRSRFSILLRILTKIRWLTRSLSSCCC